MSVTVRVFIGPLLRVDEHARRFLDRRLSEDGRAADLAIVRPPDASIAEALDGLAEVGMFSSTRAIWIRGLGSESADESDCLLEFLDSAESPDCLIVATARKLDQRSRLWKWLERHEAIEDLRIRTDKRGRLEPAGVVALANERAAAAGVNLGRAALDRIVDLAGTDVDALILEIDKVCLAATPDRPVSADLVDQVMRDQRRTLLYHLTDAVGLRSLAKAQKLVDELLDSGEFHLKILAALSNYVATLLDVAPIAAALPPAALGNAGAFVRDYFPKLPEHIRAGFRSPFRAYHVFAAAARFTPGELRSIHRRLVATDLRMKTSGGDPRLLLAGVVAAACAGNP